MDTTTDSQTTDLDVLKKKEDEHLRLQRQVRCIQADREAGNMGVHPQFRRQDHLLKTLKAEYIDLVKDLKIARSGAHKKRDKAMKTGLKKSLLYRMKTETECEDGCVIMQQLDDLIQRNKKHVISLKQIYNATTGEIEIRRAQSENRLISTENQLEVATRRFNMVQCENKKIREEIEHMLKDRMLFNHAWSKMLTVLQKGKKFLTDLFESSTLAYDQRDEWVTKLRSMQEKGKIDQVLQVQEMRDLQKAFDHEMKLYHFLAKKGVVRVNEKEEEREQIEKRKQEETVRKECQKHHKIIEEIMDYTQTNVRDTIDNFRIVEQENFSVYKLMTEICAENEFLGRDLKQIQQDIYDRKDWTDNKIEGEQKKLQKLREQLEEKKAITDNLKKRVEEKDQMLKSNMHKIGEIFRMLNCSLEPFQNLLGDKFPSLWTMSLSLTLITARIKEYIELVHYSEHHAGTVKSAMRGGRAAGSVKSKLKKYTVHPDIPQPFQPLPINLMVPADVCPACVETRWLSRVFDCPEVPFDKEMTLNAITELSNDPAYVKSDRIHPLTECRVPASRVILANRYANA